MKLTKIGLAILIAVASSIAIGQALVKKYEQNEKSIPMTLTDEQIKQMDIVAGISASKQGVSEDQKIMNEREELEALRRLQESKPYALYSQYPQNLLPWVYCGGFGDIG